MHSSRMNQSSSQPLHSTEFGKCCLMGVYQIDLLPYTLWHDFKSPKQNAAGFVYHRFTHFADLCSPVYICSNHKHYQPP